jgi:hypothetical protein
MDLTKPLTFENTGTTSYGRSSPGRDTVVLSVSEITSTTSTVGGADDAAATEADGARDPPQDVTTTTNAIADPQTNVRGH